MLRSNPNVQNQYEFVCIEDLVLRLEHFVEKFGFEDTLEAVALDAGYFTAHICKKLHEKKLFAVIGPEPGFHEYFHECTEANAPRNRALPTV